MTTPSRTCHSQGCKVEVPEGFDRKGLCLDHYLREATEKLETLTVQFRSGRGVNSETHAWLLFQVDFVVEAIGDDSSQLLGEQRSRLLELLLGIANLNEYIRRHSSTPAQTH